MTRLLILDNDPDQLGGIETAARHAGFASDEIVSATSADEALSTANSQIDIAVVDLHLGSDPAVADGLDVIKTIRSRLPECRIIALTTQLGNSCGVEAMVHGANLFIGKWRLITWQALLTEQLSIYKALLEQTAFPLSK